MNGTGDRHLDNLMIAVTQQGVDDYKHLIKHYARLKDSATVQVYKIERRLLGKMASIEDFFDRGDFCVLGEGAGSRVCSEIKKQYDFDGSEIVSDEEYQAAKKRLKTEIIEHPLFYTADEIKGRESRTAKTVRENTTRGICDFLRKTYKGDKKVEEICKKIESKLLKDKTHFCEECGERFDQDEMICAGTWAGRQKWICKGCKNLLKGEKRNARKKS